MKIEDIIPAKKSKTINLDFGDEVLPITIYEMDVDYVLKVEAGQLQDTHVNGVLLNSNIGDELVRKLGIMSIKVIYEQIAVLTYGEELAGESEQEQIKKK